MNTPTDEARKKARETYDEMMSICHEKTREDAERKRIELLTLAILEAEKRGAERERPLEEIIEEVAEMPMACETPGVAQDEKFDEWIGLARELRARGTARSEKRRGE